MIKQDNRLQIKQYIKDNKMLFEKKIDFLNKALDKKQKIAENLINYTLRASTSYYSSYEIEKVFLELAEDNTLHNLPTDFMSGSVLHVMTQSYEVGGHTRVVERWIEYGDSNQIHSVIFTSAEKHNIPNKLLSSIKNKKGEVIRLPDHLSHLEKGLELRRIASHYEIILLHIHPDDVVPIIAFGNVEFKRPIGFFNHADHKFWVGASISDLVINFRTWGEEICKEKRGILNNFLLGLPIKENHLNEKIDTLSIRRELNLPHDMQIITSVGSWHKFKAITPDDNFIFIIETLLNELPNLLFIIVGSFFQDLEGWKKISCKYHNRIVAVGPQLPEMMFKYLHASDLVIDSYPMSGGTALFDAVSCFKPVLSLECPMGQLDYIINSEAYCKTADELVAKAKNILLHNEVAQNNIKNVQKEMNLSNSMKIWLSRQKELYAQLKNISHKIHPFSPVDNSNFIDNDIYLYSEYKRIRYKFKIPYLLSFYTLNVNGEKYRELLILNKIKIRLNKKSILENV